mgnify:CR=1 FL=1
MTKADMVENIHKEIGLTKKDIALVVDEVFDMIKTDLVLVILKLKKEVDELVETLKQVKKLLLNQEQL